MGLLNTPSDYSGANGLVGLGQGFIQAFKDERDRQTRIQMYQQDRQFKQQAQQMAAQEHGLISNPNYGQQEGEQPYIQDTNPSNPYNKSQALGAAEKGFLFNPQTNQPEATPLHQQQIEADIAEKKGRAKYYSQGGPQGGDIKRWNGFYDDTDVNKVARGPLAKVADKKNAAERIEGLFTQFPDGNIPKIQTHELASAVAGMYANGSATAQKGIDDLTPDSMKGKFEDVASWLTNNPQGREQQAFIAQLHDSTRREHTIANDQLNEAVVNRLDKYKDLRSQDPDRFNSRLKQLGIDPDNDINEKGQYKRKLDVSGGGLLGGQPSGGPTREQKLKRLKELEGK